MSGLYTMPDGVFNFNQGEPVAEPATYTRP
jgi:hypothetical protein